MRLPSAAGGVTTEQVGYFEVECELLADWMVRGFDGGWNSRPAGVASIDEAVALLAPGSDVTRYLCVPVGEWTALLSNGPLGTDVGMLPSYAARELGCRALRVVSVDDAATYPARVLEVFGPEGEPPLAMERSIVAENALDNRRLLAGQSSGAKLPYRMATSSEIAARNQTQIFDGSSIMIRVPGGRGNWGWWQQ